MALSKKQLILQKEQKQNEMMESFVKFEEIAKRTLDNETNEPQDNLWDGWDDADTEQWNIRQNIKPPPTPSDAGKPTNPNGIVDIITFCEHDYYLGLKLMPMQKAILKLFYAKRNGNHNLTLKDKSTNKCEDCVWSDNKNNEIKLVDDKRKGIFSLPVISPENSPCLNCVNFDTQYRKERYDIIFYNETDEILKSSYQNSYDSPVKNYFANEVDIITQTDLKTTELYNTFGVKPVPTSVGKQAILKFSNVLKELVLVLGRRSGKAMALDTPILTSNRGWSTMGELTTKDYVFAPDGTSTRVVAKSDVITDEDTYKMEFSNGEIIFCGKNHQWETLTKTERKNQSRGKYSKNANEKIFTTEEIANSLTCGKPRFMLKRGSQTERSTNPTVEYNHAIKITEPLKYDERTDLLIHPYLLGVWLGDGSKNSSQITGIDLEIFDYIQLNCNHDIHHNPKVEKNHSIKKHNITGESLISLLKKESVASNKHIPRKYLESDYEQRLELLRGMNDSDGFADKVGYAIEFCNTNKRLADDYFELVCGLGFKAVIKESDAKLYGRVTSKKYRVTYSVPKGTKAFNLSRKQDVLSNKIRKDKSDISRIFIKKCEKLENPIPIQCIQVEHSSHCYLAGKSLIKTHNSLLASIICLYQVHTFIMMKNPQRFYGIMGEISFLNVAAKASQSQEVFKKIKELAYKSPFFQSYLTKATTEEIYVCTPNDKSINESLISKGKEPTVGSLKIYCGNSNASGQVGGTLAMVTIDEMGEMSLRKRKKGGSSDEENDGIDYQLYSKLGASMGTFRNDGLMVCISNPIANFGKFYDLYEEGLSNDFNRRLVMQCPTFLVNPTVSQSFLEDEKKSKSLEFPSQYGAIFSEGSREPWIEPEIVSRSFPLSDGTIRKENGDPGFSYSMHVDAAGSGSDNYTLAIVHAEAVDDVNKEQGNYRIIVDHIMYWNPKQRNQPEDIEIIDSYLLDVSKRFMLRKITFDQYWGSDLTKVKLKNAGFQVETLRFDYTTQAKIYQNLYNLFVSNRLLFYSEGTTVFIKAKEIYLNEVVKAKNEFINLERKWKGGIAKVEAGAGSHDDFCDAIAGAAYGAIKEFSSSRLPSSRIANIGYNDMSAFVNRNPYNNMPMF